MTNSSVPKAEKLESACKIFVGGKGKLFFSRRTYGKIKSGAFTSFCGKSASPGGDIIHQSCKTAEMRQFRDGK